jgi:apolipoprotein N-acyltransferase
MSVAYVLAILGWFATAIRTYTGAPWALALLLLVLAAPLLQPQFIAFALARALARRRGAGVWPRVLAGASAYVATEWVSPKVFGDTLGLGLYPSALMRQAADLAGLPGLTLVVVVANECVVEALGRPRWRARLAPAAGAAALVLALLAYGAVRGGGDTGGALTVAIVQADISRYERLRTERGTFEAVRTILDTHFALSEEALRRAPLALLVWPETVYPTTFGAPKSPDGAAFDRRIAAFVAAAGVPLVFGAYDAEGGAEFNAAVFLEPSAPGRLTFETYRKASLFPLTERVPAALDWPAVRRRLPWLGTWAPGAGGEVVAVALPGGRRIRVAPLICYDALDPGLARRAVRQGAELIVTLSNDSWFDQGPGPRLHLIAAAFRSIETRRPQVRATNTGISAVIAPAGELVATAGVHERTTLVATVTPRSGPTTLAVAWGEWLPPVALAAVAALLAVPRGRRRRDSERATRPRGPAPPGGHDQVRGTREG